MLARTMSVLICSALLLLLSANSAVAQFGTVGGVYIDAKGMLRDARGGNNAELEALREAALKSVSRDQSVTKAVPLRMVSLKRLEAAIRNAGNQPTPEMQHLAGLLTIRYVFFDPKTQDVVLAGPAEGWSVSQSGSVAGLTSNRPPLHLDDLLVALRYAFAEGQVAPFLGCSIEPTAEGMQRYQAAMRTVAANRQLSFAQQRAILERAMGPQQVKLFGAPGSTHFSQVMLAADYKLKRLAMAHDPSPVPKVKSYIERKLVTIKSSASARLQHRFWFEAGYDAIQKDQSGQAYKFVGNGVRVVTAPSNVNGDSRARALPAARMFCETMTANMEPLSSAIPAFAELQNVIGLATAAELIVQVAVERPQTTWRPDLLIDAERLPTAKWTTPTQTPSLASVYLVRNRFRVFAISGGVSITPGTLVDSGLKASSEMLTESPGMSLPKDDAQWWWD